MSDEFDSPREELDALLMLEDPAARKKVIDAYRAQVLREAAEMANARTESHTVSAVADVLRRMADEG